MIVLRKVRKGRVKCDRIWYKPHVRLGTPAPRHFEGKTLAFVTYPPDFKFIWLWGTEKMARAKTEEEFKKAYKSFLSIRLGANIWDSRWTPSKVLNRCPECHAPAGHSRSCSHFDGYSPEEIMEHMEDSET